MEENLSDIMLDRYKEKSYIYDIKIKKGVLTSNLLDIKKGKILVIRSKTDVINFDNKYGKIEHSTIDWTKVSKDFSGIEFAPYHHSLRMKYDWYYSLDIASGCIWDTSVLKNIILTHTFKVKNFNKKTYKAEITYKAVKPAADIEIQV